MAAWQKNGVLLLPTLIVLSKPMQTCEDRRMKRKKKFCLDKGTRLSPYTQFLDFLRIDFCEEEVILKPAANGRYLTCKSVYPAIYIYCTEIHLSLCNYMNENFEKAGEETFTKERYKYS